MMHDLFRALWQLKKQEERDLLFRDVEQLKQLQRLKMFGRFVQGNNFIFVQPDLGPPNFFMGMSQEPSDISQNTF